MIKFRLVILLAAIFMLGIAFHATFIPFSYPNANCPQNDVQTAANPRELNEPDPWVLTPFNMDSDSDDNEPVDNEPAWEPQPSPRYECGDDDQPEFMRDCVI